MMSPLERIMFFVFFIGAALVLMWVAAKIVSWVDKFVQRLRETLRIRHMPKVCVWKNNRVTAVVLKRDLEKAAASQKGVRFPVVQPVMIFSDPCIDFGQLLMQTGQAHYWPEMTSATGFATEDLERLLEGCIVEELPFFVPHSSAQIDREEQKEMFPKLSLDKAYQLVHKGRVQRPSRPEVIDFGQFELSTADLNF